MTTNSGDVPSGPLSGRVIIEWVDASDPNDATQTPNFSWSIKGEPPMDDERLALLLQEIADVI